LQKSHLVFVGNRNIEINEDMPEQLLKGGGGMVDKGCFYLLVEIVKHGVDEGGFTGPHLPGDGHETPALVDPVNHGGERLAVAGGVVEKLGIRSQVKRFFTKVEKVEIH
jgi:hypothetical protein